MLLNSNPFLRYAKIYGTSLAIENVRAATHGLIMVEKTSILFYMGGSTASGYSIVTSQIPEGVTIDNTDRIITIETSKSQLITCFYAYLK